MNQMLKQRKPAPFIAFRIVLIAEIIVFLFAATFHTGAFGVPPIIDAAIVESLCAAACVLSAYAVFTYTSWARGAAIAAQVLILAGVLLGVAALTYFSYLLTPVNISFHGVMLLLIVTELVLLSLPATRAALNSRS